MKPACAFCIALVLLVGQETHSQTTLSKGGSPGIAAYEKFPGSNLIFIKGELIVKLKRGIEIPRSQEEKSIATKQFAVETLDALNQKYSVSSIAPVFSTARKPNVAHTIPFRGRQAQIPDLTEIYKLEFDQQADVLQAIKDYEADPSVEYAEPNYILQSFETIPNEYPNRASLINTQWALDKIQAPEAWDIETGSDDVVIGIIDTGVDWNHPDLAENMWQNAGEIPGNDQDDDGNGYVDDNRGWDFVSANRSAVFPGEDPYPRDRNPMDFAGHGTHVAGIAGAVTNNSYGVAGLAWNCKIMPVRAGYKDSTGAGSFLYSDILAALQYAADNGAHVINMSFGTTLFGSPPFDDPIMTTLKLGIDYANAKGVILVAAAGNEPIAGVITYPAAFENVISVAASDKDDHKADFSCFGSWVCVAAPGVDIYSTMFDNTFATFQGTSMSTPLVSGLSALILSKNKTFSNQDVISVITNETDQPISDEYIGKGRINAYKALLVDARTDALAEIQEPLEGEVIIAPNVRVSGLATGGIYTLEYGQGIYPSNWIPIQSGSGTVNGEIATWNVSALQAGTYTLRLRLQDNSRTITDRVNVTIHPNAFAIHDGWPARTTDEVHSSPVVADLDRDGQPEIILYASDGYLYVWDNAAKLKTGWPKYLGRSRPFPPNQNWLTSMPAVADLNRDGDLDIIAGSLDGQIYALDHTGENLPGWPAQARIETYGSPTVFDLDRDGKLEVICRSKAKLGVWTANGQVVDGWPVNLSSNSGLAIWSSQAVGDLDNDRDYEIVVGSMWYDDPDNRDNQVYAFHHDGQIVEGWPVDLNPSKEYTGWVLSSPAIGDLDDDGKVEVVIGSDDATGLWVLRGDGTNFPGWPKSFPPFFGFGASPALGDIDQDGNLEIVIGHRGPPGNNLILYAFKSNGSLLSGWPVSIAAGSGGFTFGWISPVLADINGDGNIDVISISEKGSFLGTGGGEIFAFDNSGKILTGFPIDLPKVTYAAATVADIDQNGTVELLAGDLSGQLFAWDFPFPYDHNNAPWPKFRHDNWNTGLYEFKPPAPPKAFSLLEPPESAIVKSPRPTFKWENAQNFDVDSLTYSLYFSTDSTFVNDSTTVVSGLNELTCVAPYDLLENTNYFWKVKAVAGGFERWSSESWRFTVDVNAAPLITSLPDTNAYEDSLYEYMILASDEDTADTLRFSFLIKPSWLSISDTVGTWPISDFPHGNMEVLPESAQAPNAGGRDVGWVLTGIPLAKDIGDTLVSIQVSDGRDGINVQTFKLHVLHVNHAPTIPLLLVPQNGDTISLSFPPEEIAFAWRSSEDVDAMDSLRYSIKLIGGLIDTTMGGLKDTTLVLSIMPMLAPATSYHWLVEATDGLVTVRSDTFLFNTPATIVSVDDRGDYLPQKFALHQNYPNPFNASTMIAYDVPDASYVLLKVYNLLGHEVATLVDEFQPAGRYRVTFEASRLPSGVYFYRLQVNELTAKRRLILLR